MQSQTQLKRAIVIGGSIAGLLSAAVLAEFAEEVIIVERDRIKADAAPRTGVPQSPQPHILLTQGYRILKDLFPGLDSDLLNAGAVPIDWGQDFHCFAFGGWNATQLESTEFKSFSCTRPLLENIIRQHVERISNVKRHSPYRVESLVGKAEAVAGVRYRNPKNKSEEGILQADLVVDASGRSSNTDKWLAALGCTVPKVDSVDAGLGYATQRYHLPERWDKAWKVLLISHQPPDNPRLGYLARVENNELIATLGGYCQQYPPLERAGFLQFAQALPSPEFFNTIVNATPASEIKAYRSTANRLRRYSQLDTMPSGFVALGDAVCALCPAYGQGLTVSAMSALSLRDWLAQSQRRSQPLNSLTFQKKLEKKILPAWNAATQNDAGFIRSQAESSTWFGRLLKGYIRKLTAKTTTDRELSLELMKLSHMMSSPARLFHPRIIMKVIT